MKMDKRNRESEGNKFTSYQGMVLYEVSEVDDRQLAGSLQEPGFLAKKGEEIINNAATVNKNMETRKSLNDERATISANCVTIKQKSHDTSDGATQKNNLVESRCLAE